MVRRFCRLYCRRLSRNLSWADRSLLIAVSRGDRWKGAPRHNIPDGGAWEKAPLAFPMILPRNVARSPLLLRPRKLPRPLCLASATARSFCLASSCRAKLSRSASSLRMFLGRNLPGGGPPRIGVKASLGCVLTPGEFLAAELLGTGTEGEAAPVASLTGGVCVWPELVVSPSPEEPAVVGAWLPRDDEPPLTRGLLCPPPRPLAPRTIFLYSWPTTDYTLGKWQGKEFCEINERSMNRGVYLGNIK